MSNRINCEFCNKVLSLKGVGSHISSMHKDMFETNEQRTLYIIKLHYNINNDIISKIIIDYESSSLLELSKKYTTLSYNVILRILRCSNVKIKSISESSLLQSVKSKKEKTLIDKFGYKNVSQSPEIKAKKRQTFIDHYGVDNIWKFEGFKNQLNDIMVLKYGKKRICNLEKRKENNIVKYGVEHTVTLPEVRQKIKLTNLIKYGNECFTKTDSFKEKFKNTVANRSEEEKFEIGKKISNVQKNRWASLSQEEKLDRIEKLTKSLTNRVSSIEARIGRILSDNLIDYTHSFYIRTNETIFQYDYLLTDIPILIEVNGDFWHANPTIYQANDELCLPNKGKVLAKKIWKKDRLKSNVAKHKGYFVVYIWENEIKKSTDENILILIRNRIEAVLHENASDKNKIDT